MATIYRGSLWNLEWICSAVKSDRLPPGSGGRWNKFREVYAPCASCTNRWKTLPAMSSAKAAATRFRWRTLCPVAWIHASTSSYANAGCTSTPQSTRVRIELEKPFSMSLHRPVEHNWSNGRDSFCFIATKMFSELSYHNHSQVAFIYGVPLVNDEAILAHLSVVVVWVKIAALNLFGLMKLFIWFIDVAFIKLWLKSFCNFQAFVLENEPANAIKHSGMNDS